MPRTVPAPPRQPTAMGPYGGDPYNEYDMPPLPPLPRSAGPAVSSRGGHHRDSNSRAPHYHPYARPGATPYGEPIPSSMYGYEHQGPHLVDASPRDGHDDMMHLMPAAKQKQPKQGRDPKKPPRPYTEYNIFFQLERERILGELNKEQREQKETEKPDKEDGIEEEKVDEDADKKDEDSEDTKEVVLNKPSDSNDVLPRPARFAHLQLSPLWYDSTHRLKENKRNKQRRKHRKTHGLVGFLELTRMISGAWKEADPEVKGYCKKVANRQLAIYKEELKILKAKEKVEEAGESARERRMQEAMQAKARHHAQMMMRMQESVPPPPPHHMKETVPRTAAAAMPPPPFATKGGGHPQAPHYGYSEGPGYGPGKYWQPHEAQYQYPASRPPSSRPYQPPPVPQLTPTSDHPLPEGPGGHYRGGAVHHSPLDELMHRRRMYGARADEGPAQRRSPGTSRQERLDRARLRKEAHKGAAIVKGEKTAAVVHSASYLSPSDGPDAGSPNEAFRKTGTAITPSPNRRHLGTLKSPASTGTEGTAPASGGATTPSQGPMKKRLKRGASATVDAASSPNATPADSPHSDPAAASPLFAMSPTGTMTPHGDPFLFHSSPGPLSGGSGYRKALVGPYLTGDEAAGASPFPFIDWGSPRSPQEGAKAAKSPSAGPASHPRMPPHLAVPGAYGPPQPSSHPASHFPHPRQAPGGYGSPYMAQLHEDYGEEGALDLDEEEMQLLWRRLATCAKRKRMRERDAAAAWMGFGNASPGQGMSKLGLAHSFSSPVERPEVGAMGAAGAVKGAPLPALPSPNEDEDEDEEEKETETRANETAAVEDREVPLKEEV